MTDSENGAPAAVADVFDALAGAVSEVRAGVAGRRTGTAGENPSGQERLPADVHADRLLGERLLGVDGVGAYASEERAGVTRADGRDGERVGDGALSVAVDPLDGTGNLAANGPVGTVVGVYDAPLPAPGRALVGAAAVVYGPLTTMATAAGPAGDPGAATATRYRVEDGERRRVGSLAVPDEPQVYGFGGRRPDWTEGFAAFARTVEADPDLKLRYAGAMVLDAVQVLVRGGVYAYPSLRGRPSGKLRHCFEAAPAAYLAEAAGGRSTDGDGSVLDAVPDDVHTRTPVGVGTAALVERLEEALGG